MRAIEDAGIDPLSLAGSRTAVAVGMSTCDYARLTQEQQGDYGPYAATGTALSIAANRVSYALDLRGTELGRGHSMLLVPEAASPSLPGDGARGDRDAASVGGANLILVAQVSAAFAEGWLALARWTVQSVRQGCKRLRTRGRHRGRAVEAVFRRRTGTAIAFTRLQGSTAVNQDGRSNGLTAPNGLAQQRR